jgi:hypothetical protein
VTRKVGISIGLWKVAGHYGGADPRNWIGSHLIREPLGTSGLQEGTIGEQSPRESSHGEGRRGRSQTSPEQPSEETAVCLAYRHIAKQRPRNKGLYNSRCYVVALQTTDVARQWLSSDYVGTPTDMNATQAQHEWNGFFFSVRAEMLQIGLVNGQRQSVELVSQRTAVVQSL